MSLERQVRAKVGEKVEEKCGKRLKETLRKN